MTSVSKASSSIALALASASQGFVLGRFDGGGLALVEARLLIGAAARGRDASGARHGGLGATRVAQRLEALVVEARHDDRDVTGLLVDLAGASTRTRREALHGDALIGVGGRDEEFVGLHRVVRDGVGDGRGEDLADHVGGLAVRAGQDLCARS